MIRRSTRGAGDRRFPLGRSRRVSLAALVGAVLVVGFALGTASAAGAQIAPHLTGSVEIDLSGGAIRGDVCLSDVPITDGSVTVVLNRRLRIEAIQGERSPTLSGVEEPGGESVRYTFAGGTLSGSELSSALAGAVCIAYSGREQVYDVAARDFRAEDSSHLIAFNGTTVRARGVSRWFPTPYDVGTALAAEAVSFELTVTCRECEAIYMNGGGVGSGPTAEFRSELPREPYIIAGALPHSAVAGSKILGETIDPEIGARFLASLDSIAAFLESYLGVPYGEPPDVVRLDGLREPRNGRLWGYFSDPALTLVGMSLPEFVDALDGEPRARRQILGFLAHELAHRYFGWSLGAGSPQRDLFGEPFATYLELKAVRHFFGDSIYASSVDRLMDRALAAERTASLAAATPDDLSFDSYRYGYAPAMLFAFESAVGEEAFRTLLQALLQMDPKERHTADYTLVRRTARAVGIPPEVLDEWESRCVRDSLEENCLRQGAESTKGTTSTVREEVSAGER